MTATRTPKTLVELIRAGEPPEPSAGVVRARVAGQVVVDDAWGLADRRHAIPMTSAHSAGIASGSKAFTALVVMSLVTDGALDLATPARSILGDDLPLIADDVTIEHLLSHRSGIGEYLDDNADLAEYLMPVPVHRLMNAEDYLAVLDGFPALFPAGEQFAYCNGGFVVLALIAERVAGRPFQDLVDERVFRPAGMASTGYFRSDALPGNAAVGYIEVDGEWRTNVHHLPVRGGGDGGAFTTTADMERFWDALFAGQIVPQPVLEDMLTARNEPDGDFQYGLGFWLPVAGAGSGAILEGCDAGASFRSLHDPEAGLTATVIGTTADAAWPAARALHQWRR